MTSVVTGLFLKPDGSPCAGLVVVFTAISSTVPNPAASGSARTVQTYQATCDNSGVLSLTMSEGSYSVALVGLPDTFTVNVQTGGAAQNIKNIINFTN